MSDVSKITMKSDSLRESLFPDYVNASSNNYSSSLNNNNLSSITEFDVNSKNNDFSYFDFSLSGAKVSSNESLIYNSFVNDNVLNEDYFLASDTGTYVSQLTQSASVLDLNDSETLKTLLDGEYAVGEIYSNPSVIKFSSGPTPYDDNPIVRSGSTFASFSFSFVEGLSNVAESLVDFVSLLGTGICSIITLPIDVASGNDLDDSITSHMWDNTKAFVTPYFISSCFDNYYDTHLHGQFLKQESYYFDEVRTTGIMTGQLTGTAALAYVTPGMSAGSSSAISASKLSTTAGGLGFARGTQNAWNNGANLEEGTVTGAFTGLWDAAQFYAGAKIGSSTFFGQSGLLGNFGNNKINMVSNGVTRVVLDGIDGGLEGYAQPALQSIYADGYYDDYGNYIRFDVNDSFSYKWTQMYDDNSGFKNVATNAAFGSAFSTVGEAFNLTALLQKEGIIMRDINTDVGSIDESVIMRDINTDVGSIDESVIMRDINTDVDNIDESVIDIDDGSFSHVQQNLSSLKNEILNLVDSNYSSIEKTRKIYVELNQRLHYDMNYLYGSDAIKTDIYINEKSFANLDSSNVICKGWSELYRELLIDCGFDANNVTVVGGSEIGCHKWVEINLGDGNIVIADATDVINGSIDLINCKYGASTNGFLTLPSGYSGLRLCSSFDQNFLFQNGKNLLYIDQNIGYINCDSYYDDLIIEANDKFKNSEAFRQLYGYNDFDINIDTLINHDIPSSMDGYEAFGYFRRLKSILFSEYDSKNINVYLCGNNLGTSIEGATIININDQVYLYYSESVGKMVFENKLDFDNFISSLDLIRDMR